MKPNWTKIETTPQVEELRTGIYVLYDALGRAFGAEKRERGYWLITVHTNMEMDSEFVAGEFRAYAYICPTYPQTGLTFDGDDDE